MRTPIHISPDAFLFGDCDLCRLRRETDLLSIFDVPDRRDDIPTHPSGFRRRLIWDSLGLVAHADYPEDRLSHLHFAFVASDTPGRPSKVANVSIHLNGDTLSMETTRATLPKAGATPISESHGVYFYSAAAFRVDFAFAKLRNRIGKRAGVPRLAFVSFSWCNESEANQALQTTSFTRSGFEKVPVSDRQRRGV